jgi:hypothetical protein
VGLVSRFGPPLHDDLVEDNFDASRANEHWLTDIIDCRTSDGKLNHCTIRNAYSNRIVRYFKLLKGERIFVCSSVLCHRFAFSGRNDVSKNSVLRSTNPLNSGFRGGANRIRVAKIPANAPREQSRFLSHQSRTPDSKSTF